jgi:predicted transcriptional regulator
MTVEQQLKELILDRYKSLREFCSIVDMPTSTLDSIFKRGVGGSSVDNIITICKELKISVDELAKGRITSVISKNDISELIEINDILADTKERLIYGYDLTLGGEPIDRESIEIIVDAMSVGAQMATNKKHNKTHNKTHNKNKKYH